MTAPLLDVAAAAQRQRATARPGAKPLSVTTHDRPLHESRPFLATVRVGSVVRVERFPDAAQRDRYAAQARADVALLAERIEGRDR